MSIRAAVTAQRLNERVRFERATFDVNGDASGWTLVTECWAGVDGAKASSAEPFEADGIRSLRDYTIWIRSDIVQRFGIQLTDRLVWKGRAMDIKDMPDQQLRGRLIAVICSAGVNAG